MPSRNAELAAVCPDRRRQECASRYCASGACGAISGAKIADEHQQHEDDEADDRAAVLREIVPELREHARRALRLGARLRRVRCSVDSLLSDAGCAG